MLNKQGSRRKQQDQLRDSHKQTYYRVSIILYFFIFFRIKSILKSTIFWAVTPCSLADVNISEESTASSFRVEDG
jgi:hypothetical protein